jgi:hypothetical protein
LNAQNRQQKITLGEMRSGIGPTRLIMYFGHYKCAHSVVIDTGPWSDNVRAFGLGAEIHLPGLRPPGADVRPLFEPARMGGI